jgi:hypothetical protein
MDEERNNVGENNDNDNDADENGENTDTHPSRSTLQSNSAERSDKHEPPTNLYSPKSTDPNARTAPVQNAEP